MTRSGALGVRLFCETMDDAIEKPWFKTFSSISRGLTDHRGIPLVQPLFSWNILKSNSSISPRTGFMKFDARDHEGFFKSVKEDGFHIFGRKLAKLANYYPNSFPPYPEIDISAIHEGDTITIRAFFPMDKTAMPRVDSGHIDLEVEYVDHGAKIVFGNILTLLPPTFALARGTTVELELDEVLSVRKN